jgi:hypothetical protein
MSAAVAFMFFVKFIRKNFLGLSAPGAFAAKRLQVFELLKSGTVLGSSHKSLLVSIRFSNL